MKEQILALVEECFVKAEKFYNRSFERPSNVIFKTTGSWGGHSNYRKRELMFNLTLAMQEKENFLKRTVPHEVAHYVQRAVYGYTGVQPHGKEWKYVMTNVYGLEPSRCHSYDTTIVKTRKQTRHDYSCNCGKHFKLTTTMHNRIQTALSNQQKYGYSKPQYYRVCKSCRSAIKLVQVGDATAQRIEFLQKKLAALQNLKQNV